MGQIGLFLLLAAVTGITVSMLFVGLAAFFGAYLGGVERAAGERPGRAFLLGLINAAFLFAVGFLLVTWAQASGAPLLGALGVVVWLVLIVGVIFGLGGMVQLARARLYPKADGWRPTAVAGGILFLACLTPYVGWFGFLPYLVLYGLGGVIMHSLDAFRGRRKASAEAAHTG